MTHLGSLLTPDPAVPGSIWPAVPATGSARMMSLLFQLEQSQWLSADEIQSQQGRQLGTLLRHAYTTSPYYRRQFDQAGLSLESIRTPDDWRRIPLLTREDWQQAGPEIYSQKTPQEHGNMSQLFTSGSTGKPVMVVTTGLTQLLWNAFTVRDHLWHRRDFRAKLGAIRFVSGNACDPPDGRIGNNWGPATAGVVRTGPSATLHIKAGIDQQVPWLAEHNPEYLITYPSNVHALARHCEEKGITLHRLREIRTFGEILEQHTRDAVRRAFDVKIVDMYSSQEVGYIALQCPDHEHYHVQAENVLLEVIRDDGTPCQTGEIGRVVVTALHNFATPIIRYRIGDFAEVGEPCPCGRGLPVLRRVVGRQRNMLVLPNGDLRWPSVEVESITKGVDEIPPIQQFQVIQRSLEDIEALLVSPRPLTEREEALIIRWFEGSFGWSFRVTFTYVDHIPSSPTGKFEDFKSDVAINMIPNARPARSS
jgi:phenylacetate-CoA ligase